MTRELFIETIEALQKQHEHDRKCSSLFNNILTEDRVTIGYDNHCLVNQLIKLLQVAMNDEHKDSWIEYYICELDFGKRYTDVTITEKDGSIIDISDAGKLWDYLNSNL